MFRASVFYYTKNIEHPDFLPQFELLCGDAKTFEIKSGNHDLLKNNLKNICFSILKSYSFDKVEKNYPKRSL